MDFTTTIKEQVSGLARDTVLLFRKEAELAKAELVEKASRARSGIIALVIGCFTAVIALFFIGHTAALYLAISVGLPLAYLIISIGFTALALGALLFAKAKLDAEELKLHRTAGAVRSTVQTIKGARHNA